MKQIKSDCLVQSVRCILPTENKGTKKLNVDDFDCDRVRYRGVISQTQHPMTMEFRIMHAQHVLHVHTDVISCKCTGEVAITNAIEIDTY